MRPGFRRTAILSLVILMPVAAHALWDYIELRRLVREIESIAVRGEPVTEHQAGRGYRKQTAEEEVAGRLLMAGGVLGYPVVATHRGTLAPLREHISGVTPPGFDLTRLRERLHLAAQEAREALDLADRATALPFTGYPPGTSYDYRASEVFGLMQLLSIRTASLALAGAGDQAVASAITAIKARPAMEEAWSFRTADHDAAIVLSFSTPSPEALRQLLSELTRQDRPELFEQEVLGDRAAFIDRVFGDGYGGDPRSPALYRLPFRSWNQTFWRPVFTRRFIATIRGWNRLVEASRKAWPEKGREMNAIYAEFGQPWRPHPPFSSESLAPRQSWWFPREMYYALPLIPRRTQERLTVDRAGAAAVAIALYRAQHGGQLPGSLEELRPAYLERVPQDPATGGPLRFKSDSQSYTVYGAGVDATDDGGDLASALQKTAERGWGGRQVRGKDVGVRVLLTPHSQDRSHSRD